MILNFILAHAKTYAKINQPTTDMSIVISTAAATENKCSNLLTTLDTNDATGYTIVEVNRNCLRVRLQTSTGDIFLPNIFKCSSQGSTDIKCCIGSASFRDSFQKLNGLPLKDFRLKFIRLPSRILKHRICVVENIENFERFDWKVLMKLIQNFLTSF